MQQTVPAGGIGGLRTVEVPKGRWAQRIDPTGITVKSVYDSDSIIPFPMTSGIMICLKCIFCCIFSIYFAE